MTFQEALAGAKKEVERGLVAFFAKKRQEAKQISPHCLMLVDSVAEFTMRGGKRTRAFLVWLGHETVKSDKRQETGKALVQAMMALELFQSFALIHDDIIDEDTTRRGGPSVHESFRINALTRPRITPRNASHYGKSMAILAGDLALVWADELMKKGKRQTENGKREDIYQKMKQEVIFGQSLDVMEEHRKIGISKQLIDVYKTAWYSVIRPLQIGAAIGGADEKLMESFVPYGLAVGEGYQLRDDFLDGVMSEEEFQKKVKKLVVPKSATILLIDFARFAITRQS